MSNITTYINRYGNLGFEELKYNEVDSLILGILSYIDFDGILEDNSYKKITLRDAAEALFTRYSKKELKDNIFSVISAIKIFSFIKDEKRYKDLKLYNYSCKCNEDKQFSALFIDIDDKTTFISFEGTDDLISGWKEDFQMSYNFPVPSQREAIRYINKYIPIFSRREYILGGHSKGGNLALVAGMYANPIIKKKIKKIISYDGPGLLEEQIESKLYRSIESRLELIIPNHSLVGLFLKHTKKFRVISSSRNGPMCHNVLFWDVEGTKFVKAELSKSSKEYKKIFNKWLDKYNKEERKHMINQLFDVFKRAKIDSLTDIKLKNISLIFKIIEESRKIDDESKSMIGALATFFLEYFKKERSLKFGKRNKEEA